MDHREDLVERSVDVIAIGIDTQFHSGRLSDTAIIIGLDQSVFGVEADLVAVGSNGSSQSTAIVASPSNQHQPTNQSSSTGDGDPTRGRVVSVLNS